MPFLAHCTPLVQIVCFANQSRAKSTSGLQLGKLALSTAQLGMPLAQEDVRSDIASMKRQMDPLIRQDGTYLKGIVYGLGISKATFLARALHAHEFARWAQTDSLVAGAFPEMTNYGLHWLWYDSAHETVGGASAFPEFSLYPDSGWVFARDRDQSQVAINFESGLWGGYGHSWARKNSIEADVWGETLLVQRFHVGYKAGRYAETARTAAYNTLTPVVPIQE